jgi:hypothetical protein
MNKKRIGDKDAMAFLGILFVFKTLTEYQTTPVSMTALMITSNMPII